MSREIGKPSGSISYYDTEVEEELIQASTDDDMQKILVDLTDGNGIRAIMLG